MNYYIEVLKKYVVFSGRARRAEYWFFSLFNFIISLVLSFVDGALGLAVGIGVVYSLAVLLPGLAVTVRRLHDTNRSGWWILAPIVSFIIAGIGMGMQSDSITMIGGLLAAATGIALFVFTVLAGTKGENKYGADPIPAEA